MNLVLEIGSFSGTIEATNTPMGIGICIVVCVYFITKQVGNKFQKESK